MDPGLFTLGVLVVGSLTALTALKPRREGFVGVSSTATGQQMYNTLTLSSDPRIQAESLSTLSPSQQQALAASINSATSPTVAVNNGTTLTVTHPATSTPVYIPDKSSILARAVFCESQVATEAAFNNPQFAADCGICLSSGKTMRGTQFSGPKGLFFDPALRKDAYDAKDSAGAKFTNTGPSLGTCDGATGGVGSKLSFAVDKKDHAMFTSRMKCQTHKTLDDTCATCLEDGSYTFIGNPGSVPLETVIFYVAGMGRLNVSIGGTTINLPNGSLQLSSTPYKFSARVAEGATMSFTVGAPDENTPAQFYGVLETKSTTGGVFQIPLNKILLHDDQMSGKPRQARTATPPILQTSSGAVQCVLLLSGYSKPSMMLTGILPFLFAEDFPFDGVDCRGSILQNKAASVAIYGGDPCYKPAGQGPDTWSDACIQDRITSMGCTADGLLYKDLSTLRSMSLPEIQSTVSAVLEKQYNDNDSSMKCNGKNISTPCDAFLNFDVNNTPDITQQCIRFLYYNEGEGKQGIGSTYTGPVNEYYSKGANGKKIFCLPGAAYDPDRNQAMVKMLQKNSRSGAGTGRIGVPYVQNYFNAAYQRATNTGLNANLSDSQGGRGDSLANCFKSLANVPISVMASANLPNARYAKIYYRVPQNGCIQISQLAVYDNQNRNVAFGKPTSAPNVYSAQSRTSLPVDGYMGPRSYPNIYHSACRVNDSWMVDFLQVFPIKKVVYYNRADCCGDRSRDMVIDLMDANKNVVWSTVMKGYASSESFVTDAQQFNL
jgi:hypothetical protein